MRRPRRLSEMQLLRALRLSQDDVATLDRIIRERPRNAGAAIKALALRLQYTQPMPAMRLADADGRPLSIRIDLSAATPKVEAPEYPTRLDPTYPVPVHVLPPGPSPSDPVLEAPAPTKADPSPPVIRKKGGRGARGGPQPVQAEPPPSGMVSGAVGTEVVAGRMVGGVWVSEEGE